MGSNKAGVRATKKGGFEQFLDQLAEEGADEAAKQAVPHPQPRSSEGSAAPAVAAAGHQWLICALCRYR
jgi:hypothetical protein